MKTSKGYSSKKFIRKIRRQRRLVAGEECVYAGNDGFSYFSVEET